MSPADPPRRPRAALRAAFSSPGAISRAALRASPFILVTALGLWLLWPVPAGVMPLSADHTVHLTRAWLYGQLLAAGHLVGWTPFWCFGVPLGELYPPLGDLLVAGVKLAGCGLFGWPQAYALAFTLVFLLQGWALLRWNRALGLGPLPGLVAAALALLDAGAYREGGWIYTVLYGVWPQALATSLAWLALAELTIAARIREHRSPGAHHRRLALAALAAAAALLAHPMSLPMLALAAPLWLITVGVRGPEQPVPSDTPPLPPRERLAAAALDLALVLGLGLLLAAWWLLPMSAHRGYMASYGWLYAPLDAMLRMLEGGQWTQLMAPAAGYAALAGLVLAALRGSGALRFVALLALAHWLLASTDVFWTLRLDRLGSGFSHIQYQRFLTAAKPGLYLLAGALVGVLWTMAKKTWSKSTVRRTISAASALAALALLAWLAGDAWTLARAHGVGAVQVERFPQRPALAQAYDDFLAWAKNVRGDAPADYRIAVRADRNAHWFMDSPVFTGTPIYKIGFTPGDNFVHKPESAAPRVLDLAGARYLLTQGPGGVGTTPVASFGPLRVFERPSAAGLARIDGPGEVTVESADLAGGYARVRVTGAGPDARLVFHVAGYPRWDLSFMPDGGPPEPVAWVEVPVVGDGPVATPEARLRGEYRGGKALGDDGSEPTLIAAPARDGVYELRYARWRWFDVLGLFASLAALAGSVSLYRSPRLLTTLRPLARRLARPAVLTALAAFLLLAGGLRWRAAAARERPRASARLADGRVAVARHVRAGPLKTDMLIFPAVLADPRRPSEVVFTDVTLGPALTGWIALDDDDAKQRRRGAYRVEFRARPRGSADFRPLADLAVAHRPNRLHLASRTPVPEDMQGPVDLAVTITPTGDAPPRLGFDLELGDP